MNLYEMKLGDHQWVSEYDCNVLRVPGGWLFRHYDHETTICQCSSFVPFNNEFIEKSALNKVESASSNTASMQCPFAIVERFADNGEHSHWELIDKNNGAAIML